MVSPTQFVPLTKIFLTSLYLSLISGIDNKNYSKNRTVLINHTESINVNRFFIQKSLTFSSNYYIR